jgi:ABC-type sugar transport system permease subunit
MTAPALLIILAVSFYPLLNGIGLSFRDFNAMAPNSGKFVGFENFSKLLFSDVEFRQKFGFSIVYTFSVVGLSYIIGFILAMMLKDEMRGRGIYRTLFLLPWVVAPSVATTNWSWLFNDRLGFINGVLMKIGLVEKPILFLANETIAKFTVIMTGTWRNFPFMMIIILAGLQSIPKELYESAYVDGAGFWKSLYYITIPRIRGVSSICIILEIIWTFNNFENIYLLTRGGPNNSTFVMPILTYYTAFFRNKTSYASAIAVIMLIIMLGFSMIYFHYQKNNEEDL